MPRACKTVAALREINGAEFAHAHVVDAKKCGKHEGARRRFLVVGRVYRSDCGAYYIKMLPTTARAAYTSSRVTGGTILRACPMAEHGYATSRTSAPHRLSSDRRQQRRRLTQRSCDRPRAGCSSARTPENCTDTGPSFRKQ